MGRDQLIAEFKRLHELIDPYVTLQWGRDQLIAELCGQICLDHNVSGLQWGLLFLPGKPPCASMGPRSADRGILDAVREELAEMLLQWGRDQLIAELGRIWGWATTSDKLQWGRDQLIAELHQYHAYLGALSVASMGPRSADRGIGRGKPRQRSRHDSCLNGAAIS